VRRLPVRWRLTLAFAVVMAVVLAATGLFVYQRQESNLDGAVNRALVARADDVGALAQQSDSGLREARPVVSGRTAQLAQLIDASGLGRLGRTLNEMLARIQSSVDRERTFFSDASHELRSPLAMLRTELELIARERPTGSALQSATRSAIEETDRLSRLADDLLLLARADDHQLALRHASVSAAELVDQAGGRVRRQAADIQVSVDAPPDTYVEVDRDRIAQALDNLLANALRYASSNITLSARAQGTFVELHVMDDGPGFPTDFLPDAFERFARADAARTEDGVGLGLAIVCTIAETHGGRAQAANRASGGADVWITLPQAADRASPALAATPAPA